MQRITADGRNALLDLEELTPSQGRMIAEALTKVLIKSGGLANGARLTGPHLIQFAEELVEHGPVAGTIVGQLNQTDSKRGIRFATISGEHPFEFEAKLAIFPDDENSSDDDINDALSPYWGENVIITLDTTPDASYGQSARISGIKLAE